MIPIQFQHMANMVSNVAVKSDDIKYLFTADPFNFPEFMINGFDINENNRMMENETQIIKDIINLNNSFHDYNITAYFAAKEKNICREDEKVVNLKIYFVKGVEINHHRNYQINYDISPYIYIPSSCQKSLNEGILIVLVDVIKELTSTFYILGDPKYLNSNSTDELLRNIIKSKITVKDSIGLFSLEHIINALTGIVDIVYFSNPPKHPNYKNIFKSYPVIDRVNDSLMYKYGDIEMYECKALSIKYITVLNYLCKRIKDEIVNTNESLIKNILYSIAINYVYSGDPLAVYSEFYDDDKPKTEEDLKEIEMKFISLDNQHRYNVDISKEIFTNVTNTYEALEFITSSDFVTSSNYLNKKIKYLNHLRIIDAIY